MCLAARTSVDNFLQKSRQVSRVQRKLPTRLYARTSLKRFSRLNLGHQSPERSLSTQIRAENSDEDTSAASVSTGSSEDRPKAGGRGKWTAAAAVAFGAAAFIAARTGSGSISLNTLETSAVQYDIARQNNKPSLVEFYASWCEVCRELAPDVYEVEKEYKDKVNFVMLNIENPKWAPEIAEYRIGGIPHFLFLNKEGEPEAAVVGRLPQQVLIDNIKALSEGRKLPYRGAKGATSSLKDRDSAMMSAPASFVSPRSHSG